MAEHIYNLNDLVRSDRHVTLRKLDRSIYPKVCAQWVPKKLSEPQNELHIKLALQHLFGYHEGPTFLERNATGDGRQCQHYKAETKWSSMQWKLASSLPPKKFKAVFLEGKVMFNVFLEVRGPIFIEFLEHGPSINSDVFCETLRSPPKSIKSKRLGLFTDGVILLHDNARPHVSWITQSMLAKFKWEQFEH